MKFDAKLDDPLVTVVTASYNALAGLRATVQSVAAQDFDLVEHVIVDGGSNDGTREYLENLGANVRWISEADGGIADAMNKGISMARGQYICVLQAEDMFLDASSLSRASGKLAQGADFVSFEVMLQQPDGDQIVINSRPYSLFTDLRMLNPHQGLFCRKSVFDRVGLFDTSFRIGMDYEHLLRAKRAGCTLEAVNSVLSIMPATGVSSRQDWASKHELLMEQRRAQIKNTPGLLPRMGYWIFWAAFYPAYFLKSKLLKNVRFY